MSATHLLRKLFFLVLMIIVSGTSYGMEGSTSLTDLPEDIWCEIFSWLNKGIETYEYYYDDKQRASWKWQAIRKVIPLTMACRRLNYIGNLMIKRYLDQAERYLEPYGNKNSVLLKAVENCNYCLVDLCRKLGVDINTTRYPNGETLLTQAIKDGSCWDVKNTLRRLDADPMYPNARGEVPIDLAYDNSLFSMGRILKDHGGDSDKRYGRVGNNGIYKRRSYGRSYGFALLAKKSKAISSADKSSARSRVSNNSPNSKSSSNEHSAGSRVADESPNAEKPSNESKNSKKPKSSIFRLKFPMIFVSGVIVVGIGYWLYTNWKEHKKARQKRQKHRVEWEDYRRELFRHYNGESCYE